MKAKIIIEKIFFEDSAKYIQIKKSMKAFFRSSFHIKLLIFS